MSKYSRQDQEFMHRALTLAERAEGNTSPNPLVGCVIVKDGLVISEGFHRQCGGAHAEVAALNKAGVQARGATMYVTLEPCFHHGRTPPCVEAILNAGIKTVFIAVKDPNPLVSGKSIRHLRREGVVVHLGLLKKEAARLNRWFNKYITTGMPYVVAKSAQTLDGRIATAGGHSQWITSEKTRSFTRRQRNQFDAIVVGIETVLKDDPRLTPAKNKDRFTKIILDSKARLPLTARLFDSGHDIIVAATEQASDKHITQLQEKGVAVVVCPERHSRVDWRYLLKELAGWEMARILIEGGGCVIGSALRDNLVDEIHFFVAPKICGDAHAVPSITGLAPKTIDQIIDLDVDAVHFLGPDFFIQARVLK